MICTFYSGGRCIETLDQHVGEMLRAYDELYYNRGWHVNAARRLKQLGYTVEPDMMDRAARAAIILHDIGKPYAEKKVNNRFSFPLHEAYSALIAEENRETLSSHLDPGGDSNLLVDIVIKAILLHHMAMNRLGWRSLPRRSISGGKAGELRAFLAAHDLVLDIPLSLGGLGDSWIVSPQQLMSMKDYFILQPPLSRYQVTLRILRVLTVTDNIAASRVRGGRERVFVEDICY